MLLIRNVFIVSLVALVFAGSIGVDVFKHVCKKEGVSVSLFVEGDHHCKDIHEKKSCCSQEKEDDCCDDEVDHFQLTLDYFHDISSPDFVIAAIQDIKIVHILEPLVSDNPQVQEYPQPPPLSGRDLLNQKQVWII